MPNGFGRGGFGRGGGGFGFRGSSPPWPFVGLGRGGLPRCGYFFSGAAGMPVSPGYPSPGAVPYGGSPYAGGMPYGGAPMEANPYAPQMTREQELDFLRSQAEAIRGQLEQIDARIKELEKE
ncbi:MAG: rRNA methyltransferase [Chloroflexi bacterium CG_4_10_14_0_8_um_filter_46_9]|nr:MAG: rRNA methyltransferase [Chloroflexi bacterium CG15_BIG_FIL_POST_REV_8_21_14_020_46_15]PIZ26945.1 MAG: rRNA methyltransferase [Chloroflexi bacterium CG_4_10_14_0_8_um_filter_46_9]